IFFIKDGKIHTPVADCFLDGITRQTAIELAKKRGIEVIERRIMPDELTQFSECFITGSAAEVTAVSEIAQWKFTPGAITQQLMADYTAEVQPKGKKAAAGSARLAALQGPPMAASFVFDPSISEVAHDRRIVAPARALVLRLAFARPRPHRRALWRTRRAREPGGREVPACPRRD